MIITQPKDNNRVAFICKNSGGRKMRSESYEGIPPLYKPRTAELQEASYCVSIVIPSSLTPLVHWWQAEEGIPCTPNIRGSGYAQRLYDVINRTSFNLTSQEDKNRIQEIHKLFIQLSPAEKLKLKVPMERLNQAKRRVNNVDAAIDLGITLESLFLQGYPPYEQISLAFRLRAAWFLSKDTTEREENYKLFKWLYKCRSLAVHLGKLEKQEEGIPISIDEVIERGLQAAAKAIEIIIRQQQFPYWDKLILG